MTSARSSQGAAAIRRTPAQNTKEQIDRVEIEATVHRERLARDMGRWDDAAVCYNDDCHIDISWFQGPAQAFVKAGAAMATTLLSFHEMGATVTEIRHDRALTDTGLTIHLVREIDGVEVDCVGFCRSRVGLERKGERWLISTYRAIYVHDWLTPVNPAHVPHIDEARLERYRRSYRFLSYLLELSELPVRNDLPGVDRPETVSALLARERAWLAGGDV